MQKESPSPTPTFPDGPSGGRFRIRQLFTLGPYNNDHRVAIRVALTVFLPLALLIVLGRLDLSPFAVFGAFGAVYSRSPIHLDRLLMQIKGAGLMWLVVLAAWFAARYLVQGHVTGPGAWWLVGVTTAAATASAISAGLLRLRPAGALFHIFAFASVASIPHVPDLGQAMFTTSATMVFSLIIGQLGRIVPSRRTPWQVTPAPAMTKVQRNAVWEEGVAYLVSVGLTGSAALLLSAALHTGHISWAMVAAVVPLVGHSTRHRTIRAVHRVLGTAIGLGLMSVIVALHPHPWVAIAIIAGCQFMAEMFIARNYFWAQVFVTPMALVGVSLASAPTWSFLYDRAIETLIGLAVGMVVVECMKFAGDRIVRRRGAVA